jgi:glycosyltransferase involved in cell wall biosynthesis
MVNGLDSKLPGRHARILMYSAYFHPEYSGAALQAMKLARELRRLGHHVEFITNRWPGLGESEVIEGFKVHRVEAGRGQRHKEFRLWLNMLRYLWDRRGDFDILHSHGAYYTNSIVGPLARMLGMKSIVKASLAQDDLHDIGRSKAGLLHRLFLGQVGACVAISRDLENEFIEAGMRRQRVHFLPNGVDTQVFCPVGAADKPKLRDALDLPENRLVFLYVGVMDARKNIAWLVDRWSESNGFGTHAILVAVGPQSRDDPEGVLLKKLQDAAQRHPQLMIIRNFVSDIHRYYKAADLLILPSYKEGLPNVVLEAMASGLACVAARSSGTSELVKDGVTGFTYTPDDGHDFERALKACLSLGVGVLGKQAREQIVDCCSIEKVASRYAVIYAGLMHDRIEGQ